MHTHEQPSRCGTASYRTSTRVQCTGGPGMMHGGDAWPPWRRACDVQSHKGSRMPKGACMHYANGARCETQRNAGRRCMVHGAWCWCMVLLEARRESTVPEGHSAGQNLHHKLHRAPANSSSVSCELKRDPVCVSYPKEKTAMRRCTG